MKTIKMGIYYCDHYGNMPKPEYQTLGSSGLDLVAAIDKKLIIRPGEFILVPTGIKIELPCSYEAQIRPRSGLALKYGITVLNSPGTVDSDYRGEIKVILINFGKEEFVILRGMRIAQLVIGKIVQVKLEETITLQETRRNSGGFGHTGL